MAKWITLVDAVRTHIDRLYSPPPVRSLTRNRLAAHQKLCLARMTRTFITISSDEAHASTYAKIMTYSRRIHLDSIGRNNRPFGGSSAGREGITASHRATASRSPMIMQHLDAAAIRHALNTAG